MLLVKELTSLSREDPKAVVPEAGRYEEAGVHGGHETVAARLHALREVVTELPPSQGLGATSSWKYNQCNYFTIMKWKEPKL